MAVNYFNRNYVKSHPCSIMMYSAKAIGYTLFSRYLQRAVSNNFIRHRIKKGIEITFPVITAKFNEVIKSAAIGILQ